MHFEGGEMHFDESGEELLGGDGIGEPSIAAAEKEHGRALRAVRLLRRIGYIVSLSVVFVACATLGASTAVALNWWLGWPDLVCTGIQDCYELLF
jgi:hypothetical protein